MDKILSMCMDLSTFDRWLEWQPPPLIAGAFKYRTTSSVDVGYPFIGLINRVLQVLIVIWVILSVVVDQSWAYSETPLGTVNAFGGEGGAAAIYSRPLDEIESLSYCNNETHAFQYSANFNYSLPECRYVRPEQLVHKGKGQVQITTMFLENTYRGWPCSDASDAAETTACAAGGGIKTQQDNGQCECKTSKTVYPIGVEEMGMSFEHTYEFPIGKYTLDELRGSSTLDKEAADTHPEISRILDSTVAMKNPDEPPQHIPAGNAVSLSLSEWLAAAGTSLDSLNDLANPDALDRPGLGPDGSRLPTMRMTGLVLTVLISYSNGEPSIARQPKVWANITAEKQFLAWAGPGSDKIYVQYPSGGEGEQTYTYIDRYAQGVVFNFQPTGRVFMFDFSYLLNTIIAGLVLLGLAATITDTVAFYMLPNGHSAVLEAHRRVRVTKKQGFAEMGIRMANAARAFSESFDPDHNQLIEPEDIVRVLARVAGDSLVYKKTGEDGTSEMVPFDCEKAHAVAIATMMDQDEEDASLNSFTFMDFMRTQDNGTVPFPVFLEKVQIPENSKWTPTEEERRRCQEAWKEGVRANGDKHQDKLRRRNSAKTKDGVEAISVQVQEEMDVTN